MLTATIDSFSRNQYALLGKILMQKEPDTAKRLISTYLPEAKPSEEDLSKISTFFSDFCKANNIEPDDYFSSSPKSTKLTTQRLFIAVLLHLYNPQVYNQPSDQIILKYGFVRTVSVVLKQKEPNVSKMIREVIQWEKRYEEFSLNVNSIIEKLTNGSAERK